MTTKLLMTISAIILGLTGVALTFFPQEISAAIGGSSSSPVIVYQLLGALYFGFAMMNWTAKGNLIGGIYGRPVAIANLTHFTIGALALLKQISFINIPQVVCMVTYILFAVAFGAVFFTHPVKNEGT
jgi:hypothetical protein